MQSQNNVGEMSAAMATYFRTEAAADMLSVPKMYGERMSGRRLAPACIPVLRPHAAHADHNAQSRRTKDKLTRRDAGKHYVPTPEGPTDDLELQIFVILNLFHTYPLSSFIQSSHLTMHSLSIAIPKRSSGAHPVQQTN